MTSPGQDRPLIVVRLIDGGEGTHAFPKPEITLGTGPGCDLILRDGADEIHCIVARTRHGYVVEDLLSRAGTLVDGAAVRQAFVEPGAVIRAGTTSFELVEPPPA